MIDQVAEKIRGRRVLVVEDDHLLAEDLRDKLERLGARVLGPVPRVSDALRLISSGQRIDGATLDLFLGSEKAFKVADALRAQGVPFVFVTGADEWVVPEDYKGVPRHGKPVNVRDLAAELSD